ncbi:MAG: ArsA family ATPase [Deltaproteobacteria bacterium]|nr:ArsA family ATPase [Deltaproteobacteria bacterium]
MNHLHSLIQNKKMIIVMGSGGVGKTTTAAAIAVQAALLGKKTIVLTIDPAKRLATTLGINRFTHTPKEVSIEKNIKLSAMMLDTKETFDALIQKYAPSKEVAQKILTNPIYQFLSTMMAGTQEYMALEKLYELNEGQKYDTIVLDTPPAKHALNFLEAPDRLAHFLDENILKWFLKPYLKAGTFSLKMLTSGSHLVFKLIEMLTGLHVLYELSEFLLNLQSLYGGFRERTLKAQEILKSSQTTFLVVTNPERAVFEQALELHKRLSQLRVSLGGLLVNRVTTEMPWTSQEKQILTPLPFFSALHAYQKLAEREKEQIQKIKNVIGKTLPLYEIPFFDDDIHDIKGLRLINQYLFP